MSSVQVVSPEQLLGPLNEVERKHAPDRLWVAGDLAVFDSGPRVSVVGSRRASADGLRRAAKLARALVDRGMTVVSGLAEGVDTAAHEATLAAGGRTIAVLGTPLDQCFPAANRSLQEQLAREHLVVTQFAPGTSVQRQSFPMRNRTMALLTEATVIVEASANSGTQHQGWEALRLGRLLYVLKSVATGENLPWVDDLMRYGAEVLSDENLDEALAAVPVRARGEEAPF